jgi:formylglycine-generating enzyme required for sulfatase activity
MTKDQIPKGEASSSILDVKINLDTLREFGHWLYDRLLGSSTEATFEYEGATFTFNARTFNDCTFNDCTFNARTVPDPAATMAEFENFIADIAKSSSDAPKIIAADTRCDRPVARAPKPNAELEYRDRVTALFQDLDHELGLGFTGIIDDPLDLASLETLRSRLQLPADLAQAIAAKIQAPYLARANQRQTYSEYFQSLAEKGYLPTPRQQKRLAEIRQDLGLSNEDGIQIEQNLTQKFHLQPAPPPADLFPSPPAHPSAQPSRRQLLKYAGLGGRGIAIAVMLRAFSELFASKAPPPVPSESPKVSSAPAIDLACFSFETVTVDSIGQVNQRETKCAQAFTEDLGNGVSLVMVQIPAGSFQMGSPTSEAGRNADEGPQHPVTMKSFLMGRFAITQAQWFAVAQLPKINVDLKPNPAHFKNTDPSDNGRAARPVENITWAEAVEFCDRLSHKTGNAYRLPSEAEWEYACRAGTTTPFHFGETISTDLANYRGQDWQIGDTTHSGNYGGGSLGEFRAQTTPVGSFPANAFGLHDMHGNVWEWCADHWHETYDRAPQDGSAWIEGGDSKLRLLRGGSWYFTPALCRAADRLKELPERSDSYVGFRVVFFAS